MIAFLFFPSKRSLYSFNIQLYSWIHFCCSFFGTSDASAAVSVMSFGAARWPRGVVVFAWVLNLLDLAVAGLERQIAIVLDHCAYTRDPGDLLLKVCDCTGAWGASHPHHWVGVNYFLSILLGGLTLALRRQIILLVIRLLAQEYFIIRLYKLLRLILLERSLSIARHFLVWGIYYRVLIVRHADLLTWVDDILEICTALYLCELSAGATAALSEGVDAT